MENKYGELRIAIDRHKKVLISKRLIITGIIIVVVLLVSFVFLKLLIDVDSSLFSSGARGIHAPVIANITWYGSILSCFGLLLFAFLILGQKNVKLVIQVTFESFSKTCRKNIPWRQALFYIGFTLISLLVIALNLFGYCIVSFSLIQNPLHFRSSEDPMLYSSEDERFKYVSRDESPFIIANVTRYNTEDILMTCQFYVSSKTNETVSVILKSLHWTKDKGGSITDKIHKNTTVRKNSRNSTMFMFLIRSVLTIELIDDGDYGTYSCKFLVNLNEATLEPSTEKEERLSLFMDVNQSNFYAYEPPEIQWKKLELMDLTKVTSSVFHLEKQEMPIKTARVSPGGVFIDHVPYWSLADPGDITFNTTISGKDNDDCCWLSARLYKYFLGYKNLVWRGNFEDKHQRYLIRQQCVCIEDLVLNNSTVAFVRTRYNSMRKQQEKFEVGHPRQVILIPDLPCVFRFHPIMGESMWLRDDFQNCAITNDSSVICQQRFQFINNWFYFMVVVDIFNWVFSFTATIFTLGMCSFVTRGWIRHFLLPVKKVFLDPLPWTEDYTHDLYLMYDEEDRYETKVAKTLRESVEGPTFSVFDPWRDIIPGHLVSDEQERAMEESRTFCVIISDSIEDDDEQRFELAAIKKTLAGRTSPDTDDYTDNIFTIKIGDCKVDSFLSPVKANVPVNDRETNTLDPYVLHTFSEWTLSSKLSWIRMHRGGVHQRFRPYVLSMLKNSFFVACYFFMYFYFVAVSPLASEYKLINQLRHIYFEAE